MRIASWNIKGVMKRQGLLLSWLSAQKPDLVALQKINVTEEKFPTDVFADAGYYAEAHCYPQGHRVRGDYGVAILSRNKPRILEEGLPEQEEVGPRLLTVEVDGLEFSSVYAPYGKYEEMQPKIEWFESLIAHLRATRLRSEQRVLCGDFNAVPEYRFGPDGPVRNSPNYHEDVQEMFRALLKAGGLFDLYACPRLGWGDRFMFEGPGACLRFSRLEYVLGTQGVVDRNPIVRFDINYAIVHNPPFPWVRAPVVADLDD